MECGIFNQKERPRIVVLKIAKALQESITDPTVHEQLKKMGLEPIGSSPTNFVAFLNLKANDGMIL
jgi:tripartite-type tricarboxylate transporter receptor subunit TctC